MIRFEKNVNAERLETTFNNLIGEVLEKQPYPENHYEIAAILESIGWSDGRVLNIFGMTDVFELALEIFNVVDRKSVV